MGFNYVLVFSPNAIADAPHNLAATIDVPPGVPKAGLLRSLVRAFPASSVIETGSLLRDARALLTPDERGDPGGGFGDRAGGHCRAARRDCRRAGLAAYDTVILRVLGASRRQLLLLQLAEYGLLAALLAGVALVLGSGIAWLVIVQIFAFDWLPDWRQILAVLGAGLALVLAFALAGSLPLLRAKPAQALRDL